MAMPAKKYDFDSILRAIPLLTPGEKETLEIMLQEDLYNEIQSRREEMKEGGEESITFSIEEVLKEIEQD